MPEVQIVGTISPQGYLHIKYEMQTVDGTLHTPHDFVVTPNDRTGEVLFKLPQGIIARIEFWTEMNGNMYKVLEVKIPKPDSVALADFK